MTLVASVDRTEACYARISNQDGRLFPSRHTKFHRPSGDGFAACSDRILLNNELIELGTPAGPLPTDLCRRCFRGD